MKSRNVWAIAVLCGCFIFFSGCKGSGGGSSEGDGLGPPGNITLSWTGPPSDIGIGSNQQYNKSNGVASDIYLSTKQLTCKSAGTTCSFPITVDGTGSGVVGCHISFSSGPEREACSIDIEVSDLYGNAIDRTVQVRVKKVWYVDADAAGAGTGLTWADAFNQVQDAVDVADIISTAEMNMDPDEVRQQVWVAEGVYISPLGLPTTEPVLRLKSGVDVFGGFAGTEADTSERGKVTDHPTVLDGRDMSQHVVVGRSYARLNGFVITGGYTTSDAGGGMYNNGIVNLSISNCIFRDNFAEWGGGAIFNLFSSLSITNCIFSGNTTTGGGGAILSASTSTSIMNCTFSGNENPNGSGRAIYVMSNIGSSLIVTNCILWDDTIATTESEIYDSNPSASQVSYSNILGGYAGEGNIEANPMFVSTEDFHLQADSPCIDSGTFYNAPDNDIEGTPRSSGAGFDMGAYEYPLPPSCFMEFKCLSPVTEFEPISCFVYYDRSTCIDPLILGPGNTCAGAAIIDYGDGTGQYDAPLQGEAAGPGYCTAEVSLGGMTETRTIVIDEVNTHPYFTNAPSDTDILEGEYFEYIPEYTDDDLPNVNPTDPGYVTCFVTSNTCGAWLIFDGCNAHGTPTENNAPSSCNFNLRVRDGFSSTWNKWVSLKLFEVNQSPSITVSCPASVGENSSGSCTITKSDPDLPAQTLTCSVNAATTCSGVTVTGCTSVSIPSQGESAGGTSCNIVIDISDNFSPTPGTDQDSATVDISEQNLNPAIVLTCPQTVYSGNPIDCTISATDSDIPVNTLTCSIEADDTCGGALTGCSGYSLSDSSAIYPSCNVSVKVDDGQGGTATKSAQVNILKLWYVDIDATGAATGLSWLDAFNHPQDAANAAAAGEIIWVAEGTYLQQIVGAGSVLTPKTGQQFYGGFTGIETSLSQRGNPLEHPTILDGEGASYHTVGNLSGLLDGFFITGGNATGASLSGRGGAILGSTSFTVSGCVLFGNNANTYGGAIYSATTDMSIINCAFVSNMSFRGGAIYSNQGDLNISLIVNSDFIENTASTATPGAYLYGGTHYVTNSIFRNGGSTADIYQVGTGSVTYSNVIGGYSGEGNIDADPMFNNVPVRRDITTAAGGTDYLNGINDLNYSTGDIIVINKDGVARTVVSTVPGSVYFNPPLIYVTHVRTYVENWGISPATVIEDFSLLAGSPCINAGTDSGSPDNDISGNPRPSPPGGSFDIGASEYQ